MSLINKFPSILLLFLLSCSRKEASGNIELPPTPSLTSDSRWGVIRTPYARLLNIPEEPEAQIVGILRKGDSVRLVSRRFYNQSNGYWLEVEYLDSGVSGWLPDFIVEIFDSRIQADTASREGLGR